MESQADFPWKVSLKILNSGKILKTFTHVKILVKWSVILLILGSRLFNILLLILNDTPLTIVGFQISRLVGYAEVSFLSACI